MKIEILGFSQEQIIALGLKLDEVLLLRWFVDFKGTDRMEEHIDPSDGKAYYWVRGSKLVQDLPVLTSSIDYSMRRFNRLCEKGVLVKYNMPSKDGRKACFRINPDIYGSLVESFKDRANVQFTTLAVDDANVQNTTLPNVQNTTLPLYIDDNKISINRDSLLVDSEISKEEANKRLEFFRRRFNSIKGLTPIIRLTENRKEAILDLGRVFWPDAISLAFDKLEASDFLTGRRPGPNGRFFRAGFDWLVKTDNFARVLEGVYDNNALGSAPAYRPVSNSDFDGVKGGLEEW